MSSFILIGLLSGLLMGITGAGGAIVAIPLFQSFLGSTLKEATVLSLITVLLGTAANLPGKIKGVQWKIAVLLALSGSAAGFLFLPLKHSAPEWLIICLLSLIGSFSIWTVWKPILAREAPGGNKTPVLWTVISGLLLGLVTTLTGLGGGVLLVPLLLQIFRMSYEEVLPTSLASIFLISLSSLVFQYNDTSGVLTGENLLLLTAGNVLAAGFLQFSLKRIDLDQRIKLRKYVFSIATLASLMRIIHTFFKD